MHFIEAVAFLGFKIRQPLKPKHELTCESQGDFWIVDVMLHTLMKKFPREGFLSCLLYQSTILSLIPKPKY